MRKLAAILLVLLCIGAASAAPDRGYWVARYKKIESLFNDRDIQAVEQFVADKFVLIDVHGHRHSRADFVSNELEEIGQANLAQNQIQVRGISQHGGLVDVAYDWKYSLAYDDPRNGRFKIKGREEGVDTWRKFGNDWLIVQTRVQHASQTTRKGS